MNIDVELLIFKYQVHCSIRNLQTVYFSWIGHIRPSVKLGEGRGRGVPKTSRLDFRCVKQDLAWKTFGQALRLTITQYHTSSRNSLTGFLRYTGLNMAELKMRRLPGFSFSKPSLSPSTEKTEKKIFFLNKYLAKTFSTLVVNLFFSSPASLP